MEKNLKSSEDNHLIVVGSLLPENLQKELVLRSQEVAQRLPDGSNAISFLELTKEEMLLVVKNRKKIEEHKDVLTGVSDLRRRGELAGFVKKFMEKLPKGVNYSYKNQLKNSTNLSWSQFNVLIESLLLNGFIKFSEEKDKIIFIISDEEIIKNGVERLQNSLQEFYNEIEIISATSNFDKDTLKKVNLFKKKLKLDVN